MPKHMMIAIDWFGPYKSIEEARRSAKNDYNHGLYLAIGKEKDREVSTIKYVGIATKNISSRLNKRHHKLNKISKELQIWLGEVVTAEPAGRKLKITRATLDYAEWLHVALLAPPLNERKTKLPNAGVTVLNRWYKLDYATPYSKRPHKDWPNLLDHIGYGLPARAVWFGTPGRQRKFQPI